MPRASKTENVRKICDCAKWKTCASVVPRLSTRQGPLSRQPRQVDRPTSGRLQRGEGRTRSAQARAVGLESSRLMDCGIRSILPRGTATRCSSASRGNSRRAVPTTPSNRETTFEQIREGSDDTDELGVELLGRLKARSSATECANHRECAGLPPGPYRDLRLQGGFPTPAGDRRTPSSTWALKRFRVARFLHRAAVPFHPARAPEPCPRLSFARDAKTALAPVCLTPLARFPQSCTTTTAAPSALTFGPLRRTTPRTFTTSRRSIDASGTSRNPSQSK